MPTEKTWTRDEIDKMWPQAAGELKGLQSALEAKSTLTAAQLGMALQLAEVGFQGTGQTEQNKSANTPPAEVLDQIEALFDYIETQFHTTHRIPDLLGRVTTIDDLWFSLKEAREKAGRPKPKLR